MPQALIKAKDEVKAECKPMGHSIAYVLCFHNGLSLHVADDASRCHVQGLVYEV
jgi:hypothetical protein